MNFNETKRVLKVLTMAYPFMYKEYNIQDMTEVTELWTEMFKDDDIILVLHSLKRLIQTHADFPPTIAHLRKKIDESKAVASNEATDVELWDIAKKAISNGKYGSQEEYEKLPPILRVYFRSSGELRELSMIEQSILDTVNRGQFMKAIAIVKQREIEKANMPKEVRDMIQEASAKIMRIEGGNE